MGLLQSGEKTKVGQMSHSLLGSQQVDAYMFGTQKKTSPQARAKGSWWVCCGVGGIVLSRLRCNFWEENK